MVLVNLCAGSDSILLSTFLFSVCEYYAHIDCHDFVVSDCKECATYSPTITRVSNVFLSIPVGQFQV